jgi:hypothetical protein
MMKCDVCGASDVEMVSLSGRQSDGQEVDIDVCAEGCRRLEETA